MVTILPGQTYTIRVKMNWIKNKKMRNKLFRNLIRVTGVPTQTIKGFQKKNEQGKVEGEVQEMVYGTRIRMVKDQKQQLDSVSGKESHKES